MKKTILFFLGLLFAFSPAVSRASDKSDKGEQIAQEGCGSCSEPQEVVAESSVLAIVSGRKIAEKDLRMQLYMMKKQMLAERIYILLLEEEAKKYDLSRTLEDRNHEQAKTGY